MRDFPIDAREVGNAIFFLCTMATSTPRQRRANFHIFHCQCQKGSAEEDGIKAATSTQIYCRTTSRNDIWSTTQLYFHISENDMLHAVMESRT